MLASSWLRQLSRRWFPRRVERRVPVRRVRPCLEVLEDRLAPAISLTGVPDWVEQGPGPSLATQNLVNLGQSNAATGAVEAIAANPRNPAIIYAGTVNGGVWRTTDATAANPADIVWTPLTDQQKSLSISSIAFDPLDTDTVFAGTGQISAQGEGGPSIGLLRTTDNGATWTNVGNAVGNTGFAGKRVIGLVPTEIETPTGEVVVVGTMDGTMNNPAGVYSSRDGGNTWTLLSGAGGLPAGDVSSMAADPGNPNRIYVGIAGIKRFQASPNVPVGQAGIYQGIIDTDGTITWTKLDTTGIGQAALDGAGRVEVSAGAAAGNPLVAALLGPQPIDRFLGVFRSTNAGQSWRQIMNQQSVNPVMSEEAGAFQGSLHFSLQADRAAPNVFYIAGVASENYPYNGIVYRVVANDANPAKDAWTPISANVPAIPSPMNESNNTAPHADSRTMAFDANGNLLEGDDGGIVRLNNPAAKTRAWVNLSGNMRDAEMLSVGYDPSNNVVFGGMQDIGTADQQAPGNQMFVGVLFGGDGNYYQQVDTTSAANNVFRYGSGNNILSLSRRVFGNPGGSLVRTGYVSTVDGTAQGAPLRITTPVPHGLATGDFVAFDGVVGNTQTAEPPFIFQITMLNPTQFTLNGTKWNGTVGNSGFWSAFERIATLGGTAIGSPIRITTSAPHNLVSGATVSIADVAGNDQANNRSFVVTVLNPTQFTLNGTSWDGTPGTGGLYLRSQQVFMRNAIGSPNFSGLTPSDFNFFRTGAFVHSPFALNAIDPRLMMLGYTGLYEDADPDPANGLAGDVIDDITRQLPVAVSGSVTAIQYGGRRPGQPTSLTEGIAIVGTSGGQLFYRDEGATKFTQVDVPGTGAVLSIAVDPQNWREVYVVKGNEISWTPDITTTPFKDITGNLVTQIPAKPDFLPNATLLYSVTLFDDTPATAGDSIPLIGGFGGVYRLRTGVPTLSGDESWSKYGAGLPNAIVTDANYNAMNNILAAATLGRGIWAIPNVSAVAVTASGPTSAVTGSTVTYTVTVTNNGPVAATPVGLAVPVPAGLSGVTFTSTASGGASGNTASGSGPVSDTLTLPDGASVTYTIIGTVSAPAGATVKLTATATPPKDINPTPAALTASVTTMVVSPSPPPPIAPAATTIQVTTLHITPNLLNLSALVTLTAQVSNPAGSVNEGLVTFTLAGLSVQGTVQNGTANAQVAIPLLSLFFPMNIPATYADNSVPTLFGPGSTVTPVIFNLLNLLLPSVVTLTPGGGEQNVIASPFGPLVFSYLRLPTFFGSVVLETFIGAPVQAFLFGPQSQFLGSLQ